MSFEKDQRKIKPYTEIIVTCFLNKQTFIYGPSQRLQIDPQNLKTKTYVKVTVQQNVKIHK